MAWDTTHGPVLVVDDDDDLRASIVRLVRGGGYTVLEAADGAEGLDVARTHHVACVLSDVRMPSMDGFGLLTRMREEYPDTPVILLTAHGELDDAVRAIAAGAFDYLPKPVTADALRDTLALALEHRAAKVLPRGILLPDPGGDGVVGQSEAMVALYLMVARAAAADVPVVIHGETGSGKEWVARAIHRHSARKRGAFVAVNCAALAEGTLESELFGHARGSFTGASGTRRGLFQVADGGVLFLDEVGDLPLRVQAELLRVLQEGEIRPVGSDEVIHVNVRVVSATHRDLDARVASGEFRQDLLYRLRIVSVELPSLRARADDIVPLAEHFLRKVSPQKRLSPEACKDLLARPWRGNVRELRAAIERAAALSPGTVIVPGDLPPMHPATPATGPVTGPEDPRTVVPVDAVTEGLRTVLTAGILSLADLGKHYVRLVAEHFQGNKSQAADALGIDRKTLRRMLGRPDDGPAEE